jgi:hypothetical protein
VYHRWNSHLRLLEASYASRGPRRGPHGPERRAVGSGCEEDFAARAQELLVSLNLHEIEMNQNPSRRFYMEKENAIYWERHASELHAAACYLWNSEQQKRGVNVVKEAGVPECEGDFIKVERVFRMLFGMALELLLKSTLVRIGKEPNGGHDLLLLGNSLNLKISMKDRKILQVLSQSISWEGRYPVPNKEVAYDLTHDLMTEIATTRVPGSRIDIRKPNKELDLPVLQILWEKIVASRVKIISDYSTLSLGSKH